MDEMLEANRITKQRIEKRKKYRRMNEKNDAQHAAHSTAQHSIYTQ